MKETTTHRHLVRTPDGDVIAAHYAGRALRRRRTRRALDRLIVTAAMVRKQRELEAMFSIGDKP